MMKVDLMTPKKLEIINVTSSDTTSEDTSSCLLVATPSGTFDSDAVIMNMNPSISETETSRTLPHAKMRRRKPNVVTGDMQQLNSEHEIKTGGKTAKTNMNESKVELFPPSESELPLHEPKSKSTNNLPPKRRGAVKRKSAALLNPLNTLSEARDILLNIGSEVTINDNLSPHLDFIAFESKHEFFEACKQEITRAANLFDKDVTDPIPSICQCIGNLPQDR
jgi:hypothetical protein